jgi:hypothetical protein
MAFDGLWTINCVTVSFANYVLFRFFPISNFSYLAVKRAGRHSHRLGGLFYGQFILLPGLMYLIKIIRQRQRWPAERYASSLCGCDTFGLALFDVGALVFRHEGKQYILTKITQVQLWTSRTELESRKR